MRNREQGAQFCRMLGCADAPQLQRVRKVIEQYAPQDMQDVESMTDLGRLEYES